MRKIVQGFPYQYVTEWFIELYQIYKLLGIAHNLKLNFHIQIEKIVIYFSTLFLNIYFIPTTLRVFYTLYIMPSWQRIC